MTCCPMTCWLVALAVGLGSWSVRGVAAAEGAWPWPVPVDPPAITGTFMEARQGGYHAGLDLRTQGRTGLPVRSPVDGWVSRARTSPRGYGKALYLRSEDGLTLVFAHLSRFHGPVQERLRAAMERTGRYDQDLYFAEGALQVGRGEIIALTGDTGTGAPHLHLEVRDAAGRPQNPARWFAVPDTVAPRFRSLRLMPLDAKLQSEWPSSAIVTKASPQLRIPARGRFAVSVDVRDATGFSPFDVAPYGVVLHVDGEEVYRVEQRGFAFEQSGQIHLEFDRDGEHRWLRLHRREGMIVPGRTGSGTAVDVRDTARRLEIEAYDLAGNRASIAAVLDPQLLASPRAQPEMVLPAVTSPESILDVGEALVHVSVPGARGPVLLNAGRSLSLLGEGSSLVADLQEVRSGRLVLMDAADTLTTAWLAVPGRAFAPLRVPGTGIEIDDRLGDAAHPGGALLVDVLEGLPQDPPAATRALSAVLRLRGVSWAVKSGLTVAAGIEPDVDHVVWMQRTGRRWKALETQLEERPDTGRWASARLREAGEIVLVADRADPLITVPAAAELLLIERGQDGPHGLPQPRWPELQVAVTDRGAGIGDRSPEVLLGGHPHPAVWDPEREVLHFDWFVDPGPGRHTIEIRATDRTGRRSVRSFEVTLRRRP